MFIYKIKDILEEYNIKINISNNNMLFRLMSEKQEVVLNLLNLLYENSTEETRLKRKYQQYLKIYNYYNLNSLAQ